MLLVFFVRAWRVLPISSGHSACGSDYFFSINEEDCRTLWRVTYLYSESQTMIALYRYRTPWFEQSSNIDALTSAWTLEDHVNGVRDLPFCNYNLLSIGPQLSYKILDTQHLCQETGKYLFSIDSISSHDWIQRLNLDPSARYQCIGENTKISRNEVPARSSDIDAFASSDEFWTFLWLPSWPSGGHWS